MAKYIYFFVFLVSVSAYPVHLNMNGYQFNKAYSSISQPGVINGVDLAGKVKSIESA
ncbi:hypothetical protein Q8W30_00250 [Neptunomonas phycophila]|uniref:Uncharacterized protein n=1 Tax=Neptunomonas phycophila TaxID=1572645 RepID=A0ABT9EPI9_9GAMM|nr:hypothetical protein [Neptunomonas phycophila]MDP2520983.1 hypothetical protein [Neptunomonas phycophila]